MSDEAISIDQQVTSVLAQQLANESLGLRQDNIRLNIEKEQLQKQVAELEANQKESKKK